MVQYTESRPNFSATSIMSFVSSMTSYNETAATDWLCQTLVERTRHGGVQQSVTPNMDPKQHHPLYKGPRKQDPPIGRNSNMRKRCLVGQAQYI